MVPEYTSNLRSIDAVWSFVLASDFSSPFNHFSVSRLAVGSSRAVCSNTFLHLTASILCHSLLHSASSHLSQFCVAAIVQFSVLHLHTILHFRKKVFPQENWFCFSFRTIFSFLLFLSVQDERSYSEWINKWVQAKQSEKQWKKPNTGKRGLRRRQH